MQQNLQKFPPKIKLKAKRSSICGIVDFSYISTFHETVATSRLALRWMYDSPRTGCARRTTPIYMWHEQAIIEWSWHVISILLAATVWSFAHLPLRLSDRNNTTMAFWVACSRPCFLRQTGDRTWPSKKGAVGP